MRGEGGEECAERRPHHTRYARAESPFRWKRIVASKVICPSQIHDVDWSGRPHVGLTEFAVLISGFQNAVGRRLWAEIFSNWSASGIISGVIWDVSRLPLLLIGRFAIGDPLISFMTGLFPGHLGGWWSDEPLQRRREENLLGRREPIRLRGPSRQW